MMITPVHSHRPDLSPYLVHLSRNCFGATARDNVISILKDGVLEARSPFGAAKAHFRSKGWCDSAFMESQRVVCFSETPISQIDGLVDPGIERQYEFQPYGVIFTRDYLLTRGVSPVGYLNQYPGDLSFEWPIRHYNRLMDAAVLGDDGVPNAERWNNSPIAHVVPYLESIGEWNTIKKDFSFEREWRHIGDLEFALQDVFGVVVREGDKTALWRDLRAAGIPTDELIRFEWVAASPPTSAAA